MSRVGERIKEAREKSGMTRKLKRQDLQRLMRFGIKLSVQF